MAKTMTDKKRNTSRSQMAEPKARSNEKEQPVKSTRASREEPVKSAKAVRQERKEVSRQESRSSGRRDAKGSSSLAMRFRQNRIGRFIIEAYYELRHKVTWPTFEEARNMTITVIVLSAVIGGILALADIGLVRLFLLISGGH